MRQVTVTGITLQFDADQCTNGSAMQQALRAIEMINGTLQRQPYGLAAALLEGREALQAQFSEVEGAGGDAYEEGQH